MADCRGRKVDHPTAVQMADAMRTFSALAVWLALMLLCSLLRVQAL